MHPILFLRRVALAEGISFLLLLGIAMPLKYAAGWPLGVSVVGMIHGLLFLLFLVALVRAKTATRLPLGLAAMAFVAALLPFGPFVIDGRLAKYQTGS